MTEGQRVTRDNYGDSQKYEIRKAKRTMRGKEAARYRRVLVRRLLLYKEAS